MTIETLIGLSAICVVICAQAQAQAQDSAGPQALYAASLAASCANCHGTEGRAAAGSRMPSLAGLDKAYLVAQLNAFKSGARPATVMQQIGKGFNDVQIETLASYFAAQKK
jgi:cytochrome subunit of sulfide dehydrogenase